MISLGEKLLLVTFGVTWIRTCLSVLYTPCCRFLLWPGHWTLHLPYKEKFIENYYFIRTKIFSSSKNINKLLKNDTTFEFGKHVMDTKWSCTWSGRNKECLLHNSENMKLRGQVYKMIQFLISECPWKRNHPML